VLSAPEKAAVEEKLRHLGGGDGSAAAPAPARIRDAQSVGPPPVAPKDASLKQEQDRPYVPGSKVLKLTERELNGLLNANTGLGESVRLELGKDAINAYVAVPIPQDFPIGGGKMFRARGRFRLSLGEGGAPYAILEEVTVFGLKPAEGVAGGAERRKPDWRGGGQAQWIADSAGDQEPSDRTRGSRPGSGRLKPATSAARTNKERS